MNEQPAQDQDVSIVSQMLPAMTVRELGMFKDYISKKSSYLEFGCGGSTSVAASSGLARLVSVESDRTWIEATRKDPAVHAAEKAGRLKFRHIDLGPLGPWGAPSTEDRIRHWPSYYFDVWKHEQSDFDIIFIDGRLRSACALVAAALCKEEAVIAFHDYSFRAFYSDVEKYVETIDTVDSLSIFKRRKRVNIRALLLDISTNLFNLR